MRDTVSPRPAHLPNLFGRLRWRLLCNSWRVMLGQSSVRPVTILATSLLIWCFVFGISMAGFHFLEDNVKVQLRSAGGFSIIGIIFDLLFLALGMFLVFSSGLILYGSLFSSQETVFLLSKPVLADRVFAYKYQGAVAFSSYAFLLLGAPILIAYGIVCHSPWPFYVFLPLFFLGFILLPSALGSLCCLLIVNFMPRRRKQVLILIITGLVVVLGLWIWSVLPRSRASMITKDEVNRLLDRFTFASGFLVPSHWVADGLRAAGTNQIGDAFYYLALVWSNGLFLYLLVSWSSVHLYRRGYNQMATGGALRRRYGGAWLDRGLGFCLFFLRPTTRILLIKDFRTFRRDPQQWAQISIFSGLMLLYVLNIRGVFMIGAPWPNQNAISLLNLSAVALLLCTYTGRFVYPLLSLEGRKFWILGLLPIQRDQLLWGKFAFSTTGSLLLAGFLVLVSDLMLRMPAQIIVLHMLAVVVLSAGLSGMSVGLGAAMPNFRETDPSKIAVGFGGTLNLVACLLFLVLVLTLMVFPWHLEMMREESGYSRQPHLWIVIPGAVAGLCLGAAAVFFPLRLGVRTLRQMEF
jgi:ABC-2 type transport system permease protein